MLVFIIFKDVIVIVIINVIVLGIILIFYNNLPLLNKKIKIKSKFKVKKIIYKIN